MIVLDREELKTQAGMERSLVAYFEDMRRSADTFNAMLNPAFAACDREKRTLLIRFDTKPWMKNPGGILHGGIAASVLDFAMGLLCRCCTGGYMTPTVSMDVHFLRPGPLEKTLYIGAEVTHAGLSVAHAAARIWAEGEEERIIASAAGTYFVTNRTN